MALLHHGRSDATVRALQPCRLWWVSRQSFRRLLHRALHEQELEACAFLGTVPRLASLDEQQVRQQAIAWQLSP